MKKNYKVISKAIVLLFVLLCCGPSVEAQTVTTYSYTGALQSYTVPSCVATMTIEAWGAQGANQNPGANGGLGGYAKGTLTVSAGQVLNIYVGGQNGYNGGALGGINGNSVSNTPSTGLAGNGGGASDIRIGGIALSDRVFVAGGGGGGGHNGTWTGCQTAGPAGAGGAGGGLTGVAGLTGSSTACNCTNGGGNGGGGGTQLAGGAAGTYNNIGCLQSWSSGSPGTLGFGGAGSLTYHNGTGGGGGGGGGYYGGGSGGNGSDTTPGGGGGGGSSFMGIATSTTNSQGIRSGDGQIIISYFTNGAGVVATPASTVICVGTSVNLNATGVVSYTWSNGSNAQTILVSPTTNTVYTVQGTNNLGCVSSQNISFTVSPGLPVLSVNSSTNQICLGKTVTLTASGALTYTWTGGVQNGLTYTPTVTQSYTVSGQNGCGTTTAVTTVSVAPLPVTAVVTPTTICAGRPATLSAVAVGTLYIWTPFPGALIGQSLAINPTVTTIYTIAVSDGTCSGNASVTLSVTPVPTLGIATTASMLCTGDVATITANGAVTYTWLPGNSQGPTLTATPNAPTQYTVTGTNSLGCTSTTMQIILTLPSPTVVIQTSGTLVCPQGSVSLTALGASGYAWTNGPVTGSNVINVISNMTLGVTGTSTNGCSNTKTITLGVFTPTFNLIGPANICTGSNATLLVNGADGYLWDNGSNASIIIVTPTVSTIYTVTANTTSNNVNCSATKTILVNVNAKPPVTALSTKTVICKGESALLTASGASTYTWMTSNGSAGNATLISVSPTLAIVYTYTLFGTDVSGCENNSLIQVKVNPCNGLAQEKFDAGGLLVYPNPSSGDINIEASSEINLSLVNELGQLLRNISLSPLNHFKTTVIDLPGGIYFLWGKTQEGVIRQKLVVER